MLRYYRFIIPRSRNLVLIKKNVVERNTNYSNIQSFRFTSSNTVQSDKHLARKGQSLSVRKRYDRSNVAEESETEKLINTLTNRGDFYGVKRQRAESEPVSVEIAVSKLKTWLDNNQRITAESFVKTVLVPLQEKNPKILRMIKLDPTSYIPYFIRCCGLVMSDISEDQKLIILEHLLQAFKDNKIKMDIHAYNAILKVWLENDCEFDVDKILEKVELDLKLEPNVEFYNNLLWRLAELKEVERMKKMLLKMTSRGIVPNLDTELSQIFAASATNSTENANLLVTKAIQKYGDDMLPYCLAAKIRGTLLYGNIDKFRQLLRSAVINAETSKDFSTPSRYILNISYDALFDIIWRLAKLSRDGDGQEFAALSQQILDSAQRSSGFFKRLIREAERHIAHKYYYSAAALINDTQRVKRMLDSQRKDTFIKQLMPRLANHMIRNRTSNEVIKDVANRLIVAFGPELRFYEDLAYSILLFKGYDYDERFRMFSQFVDAFDPERSRPHLILPLLVRCSDLQKKHILIYRCSEIGYSDIALISPFMIVQHIFLPMLETYEDRRKGSDFDKLTLMSKVLESFHVKPEHTWRALFEYTKDVNNRKFEYALPIDLKNLKKWLSTEYEKMFKDKVLEAEKKKAKYTYEVFQRLLKNHEVEKIHLFLIQRGGFPPEIKENDIDALIKIYLRHANYGYIKKLLHLISNATTDSSPFDLLEDNEHETNFLEKAESLLKPSNLLQILNRYYQDTKNVPSVNEYVFELRRLFPDVVVKGESRFDCSYECEKLFQAILTSENVTIQSLHECIDLFTSLLKHDFILLSISEVITVSFIERVNSRFGWDAAVDTWLKFQSNFHCTNGLFPLMKFALNENDNTKLQFLLHRAKNFVSSSRVNSLLAATYLHKNEYEKAKEIFEKENVKLQAHDCSSVFQLMKNLKNDCVIDFVELCLKYTNLRSDEKRTNFFIRGIANNYQGQKYANANPLKFYFLLKKYGVYFDLDQMEKLSRLLQPSRKAFEKWMFDPSTALLNDTKQSFESEQQQMLNEFDKDYESIKNGGNIESSSFAWENSNISTTTAKMGENRII